MTIVFLCLLIMDRDFINSFWVMVKRWRRVTVFLGNAQLLDLLFSSSQDKVSKLTTFLIEKKPDIRQD